MLYRALSHIVCGFTISALILTGCGGSSAKTSKDSPNTVNGPTTVVKGVVTQAAADNTLTVAGRSFTASDAAITENGESGNRSFAGVGMTVAALVGPDNKAQVIDVAIVVRGPIGAITTATRAFTVLGQAISYTPTTVFNGTSAATLQAGNVVSVSGSAANGSFTATRVDFVTATYTPGEQLQVTGIVQGLNAATTTFNLGTLSVNYAGAPALTPAIANGMNVAVGGTTLPLNNIFIATEIAVIPVVPVNPTPTPTPTPVTVAGAIASVDAATGEFVVTGQRIRTDATTRFVNGTVANIVVGTNVTVIGVLSNTDIQLLNATDVTFSAGTPAITPPTTPPTQSGPARILGPVEAIDLTAGTLKVLGITVKMEALTLIAMEDDPDNTPITLADIQVGDIVDINGPASGESVTATAVQIEEDEEEDDARITAQVSAVGSNELTVLGIKIAATSSTETQLFGLQLFSPSESLDTFFATVKVGDTVEIEGSYAAGVLTADELEIAGAEDDSDEDD